MTIGESTESHEPAAGPLPQVAATPEEFAELLPRTRRALLHRLAAGQTEGGRPP